MRRTKLITIIFCLLLLCGGTAVIFLPQVVPYSQCNEVYKMYSNRAGIDATFVRGYVIDDTITVDVTLLRALDTAGWNSMRREFAVPDLDEEIQHYIDNGGNPITVKLANRHNLAGFDPDSPDDVEVLAISYIHESISIFHTTNKKEIDAIINHNLIQSLP